METVAALRYLREKAPSAEFGLLQAIVICGARSEAGTRSEAGLDEKWLAEQARQLNKLLNELRTPKKRGRDGDGDDEEDYGGIEDREGEAPNKKRRKTTAAVRRGQKGQKPATARKVIVQIGGEDLVRGDREAIEHYRSLEAPERSQRRTCEVYVPVADRR